MTETKLKQQALGTNETAALTANARVYRTTSNQSINSGSWTKVQFNGEAFDPGGNFDNATNYRFVAPVKGKYFVATSILLIGLGDQRRVILAIYKNNAEYSESAYHASMAQDISPHHSDIVDCNATDYIEIFLYHDHGSAREITTQAKYCFASFALIGKEA